MLKPILAAVFVILAVALAAEFPVRAQAICPDGTLATSLSACGPATATAKKQGKSDPNAAKFFPKAPEPIIVNDDPPKSKPKSK